MDATLRFIAGSTPGSQVLITYVTQKALREAGMAAGASSLSNKLKQVGEPWAFGLDPREMGSYLSQRGLTSATGQHLYGGSLGH